MVRNRGRKRAPFTEVNGMKIWFTRRKRKIDTAALMLERRLLPGCSSRRVSVRLSDADLKRLGRGARG